MIASRLSEYLPHKRVLLIEAGPSDFMDNRVLDLRQWLSLLGGELDYDYGTTEQPMGKALSLKRVAELDSSSFALWTTTTYDSLLV